MLDATRETPIDGGRQAVVIGGSVSGLLAARVLADHFDRVLVLERDRFPCEPGPRKGVPQARHAHVLLARGERLLEQLFPGLTAELSAAGAVEVDWARDAALLSASGWGPRFRSGVVTHACTRDLLEWMIRRRLSENPRVEFLQGVDAVGLVADESGKAVSGVSLRYRAADAEPADHRVQTLLADFVVDASGRTSRAPRWLEALGYPPPEETVINSFLGYASRWYEHPVPYSAGWVAALISSRPPETTRVGVVYPVEGRRWIVTLSGAARDYPPTDEAGFAEFARSLRAPEVYDAICAARAITPIYGYQRTENSWRHYERLDRWPERFVVLGDAACAFNPVYGQGMSAGALAAFTLERCLHEGRNRPTGLSRRFQRELARSLKGIWLLATGADFRYPETEGGKPGRLTRLMHNYIDRVVTLGTRDPAVQQTFLEVTQLIKPPAALFRPRVLVPTLVDSVRPVVRPSTGSSYRDLAEQGARL